MLHGINWMGDGDMDKTTILGLLARHFLTAAAGWLAAHGLLGPDPSATEAFVGAGMLVAGVGWSAYQKYGKVAISEALARRHGIPAAVMTAAAVFLLTGPVMAADMPVRAPAAVATVPWSSLYFGVVGAGAKSEVDTSSEFLAIPGSGNIKPTGLMAGGLVGAGTWVGNLFLGIEADGSYDFSKADKPCVTGATETALLVSGCQIKSGWFLTQRLVVGAQMNSITGAVRKAAPASVTQWRDSLNVPSTFAASTVMPYLTGGMAERRTETCIGEDCTKRWLIGPVFGGGLRIPVSSGMSLGVEYLYANYNKHFNTPSTPEVQFKAISEHLGRISLTGHF
jgi:opacity protein-like surface antigen